MLDRITEYSACLDAPDQWAIATIVSVSGSTPTPVGTSMAVSADLEIIGSLSGGCVESAVAASAQDAISQAESRREVFGPDGTRFETEVLGGVGLTCGGRIEVLIQPLATTTDLHTLRQLAAQTPGAPLRWDRRVSVDGSSLQVTETRTEAPLLFLSGVHDTSVHLAAHALQAGWTVHIADMRPAFATLQRVPPGVHLHVQEPAEALHQVTFSGSFSAVCVMSHHPGLDTPVLDAALRRSEVHFIGAMGSQRAVARRDAELADRGHPAEARRRIHSPLGLDLRGSTPAEAAVSMLAELILAKNTSGAHQSAADQLDAPLPLAHRPGPIHAHQPRSSRIMEEVLT